MRRRLKIVIGSESIIGHANIRAGRPILSSEREGRLPQDPEEYERWIRTAVDSFVPFGPGEDLFFVNAWNEWAEGNHLEPCRRWGHAYLEATQRGLSGA